MKILDLSAGNRAMWFDKKNTIVTFVDIRPEVNPDIIADSRNLPGDFDNDYDLVVFDPPHVNCGENSHMGKEYGHHTSEEIRILIRATAKEAHRVTLPNGLMVFKWNDHDQKLERVLALMNDWWEPLFGQLVAQRTKHTSGTYWVILKKK